MGIINLPTLRDNHQAWSFSTSDFHCQTSCMNAIYLTSVSLLISSHLNCDQLLQSFCFEINCHHIYMVYSNRWLWLQITWYGSSTVNGWIQVDYVFHIFKTRWIYVFNTQLKLGRSRPIHNSIYIVIVITVVRIAIDYSSSLTLIATRCSIFLCKLAILFQINWKSRLWSE